MDIKICLERAWYLTRDNLVMLIAITLVMAVVSALSLGILGPVVFAGYIHSLLLLVRRRRAPRVQDLFARMSLFLPLLVFAVVSSIGVGIGLLLFFIPGIALAVAISFFCLYMVPFMVDYQLGLVDAVRESAHLVLHDFQTHAVTALIYIGLCWLGSLVAVGWVLTLPFGTIFILQMYDNCVAEIVS